MVAIVGFGCLFIALLVSLYAIGTAIYGLRSKSAAFVESARLAAVVNFFLITLAVLSLLSLIVAQQYQYTYVFRVISRDLPFYLKLSALWGGQAGSLLFWVWLLSGMIAASLVWGKQKVLKELIPWVVIITMTVEAFFLFMSLFLSNPFEEIWIFSSGQVVSSMIRPAGSYMAIPKDGLGLNPLLRHWAMILHPPLLYLGFVSFIVPFSYALASLITGRTDYEWVKTTRGWTLSGWIFLSAGLILGSRWSYDVLGWGGYWGWDPVEIAALMPWLTATAFLHSAVVQERRDLFKRWNYILILLTFCLVILGTFLTRSGVVSSVHAFAESSIGPVFFVLLGLVFAASLGLLLWHWNGLTSSGTLGSFFSRESLFLFNNLLFICIFLICLTGVLFPIASQVLIGQQVTVGPQWYKTTTGPLFALLILLMGIVPLSAWGASTTRNLGKALWKPAAVSLIAPIAVIIFGMHSWGGILTLWLAFFVICVLVDDLVRTLHARRRNGSESFLSALAHLLDSSHRRYGGYLVHLGIVLMAVGITGIEFFQTQTQVTLAQGNSVQFAGFKINYDNLQTFNPSDNRQITAASLSINPSNSRSFKLTPHDDYYSLQQQSVSVPGLSSSLAGDLYIVLAAWNTPPQTATFRIFYNPLFAWLWIGSAILLLGGAYAFWPDHQSTTPEKEL